MNSKTTPLASLSPMLLVNNISTKTFSGNTVQAFIFYMRGCYIMKKYVKTVQQHVLYLFGNKA